jgi:hypothetical protein
LLGHVADHLAKTVHLLVKGQFRAVASGIDREYTLPARVDERERREVPLPRVAASTPWSRAAEVRAWRSGVKCSAVVIKRGYRLVQPTGEDVYRRRQSK